MSTFISQINGKDIYAKRAEATRSGVNLETYGEGESQVKGILPAGLEPGHEGTNAANILATQQYVLNQMEVANALIYKGTVNSNSDLPDGSADAKKYKTGWTYKVATAGTYAGKVCEVGDLIIANKDWVSGTAFDADWDVIQTNIDGAVTGPASGSVADGELAVFDSTTGKVIKGSGVTTETTLSASSDVKVPTSKAVKDAIDSAVGALDAEVTSSDGTNVQVKVTEVDGKITAVNITTDNTINATDLSNAINDLDVSDLVKDTTGSMAGKTLKTLSETDGKISATFQDIKITSDKVTDRQTSTFNGAADTLTTGVAVKAAIDALDVDNITANLGAGKTITALSETDGKIAATASDIAITGAQVTVSTATNGNFVGLDASGHLANSGSKAADFATAAQGVKADSAIQGVKLNNVELTKDADNKVNIPYDTSAHQGSPSDPGLMTYETVDL